MDPKEMGTIVGQCASLAAILEVSAYPKPGNVHRLQDFPDTRYEHFLAGSIGFGPVLRTLAMKRIGGDWSRLGIGEFIYIAVDAMFEWQKGGNVQLGVILLFAPMAAAAGAIMKDGVVDVDELQDALGRVIEKATHEDSVNIYRAINRAMSKENLGDVDDLDVSDASSLDDIVENEITPIEVFRKCSDRDSICSEWVSGFDITFTEGYPFLKNRISKGMKINEATVDTFLHILSKHPDSLIQRKKGRDIAQKVSVKAAVILEAGGASSDEGTRLLWELDNELQYKEGVLNPGTSADLTAASLFVLLLSGWRP